MAVFHELSRAEGPSQQSRKTTGVEWAPNPGPDRTGSEFPAKSAGNPCQSCQSRGRSWVAMKSAGQFFMNFRGPKAHPNRGEKPPRGVGSEPGDRQDWQRISGKMRRKSMPVLSVPGALVGGDEVSMAVFHELSRAAGPSQQGRKTTEGSGLRTRGQTGLAGNYRARSHAIHASLVSHGGARGWR